MKGCYGICTKMGMTKKADFRVKQLDRRNRGYSDWKYYIDFYKRDSFNSTREWAWGVWGASKDLDDWLLDNSSAELFPDTKPPSHNDHWCWCHNQYYRRLYIRTDQELVIFKLKWT
jgi:hypothetical protein